MLEQLRRQLEITTGDVVDPLDGPSPAHPTRRQSERGFGQDLPAQVQGLVADPSALAKLPRGAPPARCDQEHPWQASLPQELHRTSNPDASSRIDPSAWSSTASSLAWATHHSQMNISMGRASTE